MRYRMKYVKPMSPRYLLLIPGLLLLTSCVEHTAAGPEQYDSKTVDAEGAESARVELHMGAGDLRITDGAQQLARADFTYNVPSWKPEIHYTKSGTRGDLRIEQPKGSNVHLGNTKYRWEVQLNNKVPMELEVHFGAGQARLDIGSLQLRRMDLHMGVGEVDMDLRGRASPPTRLSMQRRTVGSGAPTYTACARWEITGRAIPTRARRTGSRSKPTAVSARSRLRRIERVGREADTPEPPYPPYPFDFV
jgi:N-terminal domain of toast_rack, DUF2154